MIHHSIVKDLVTAEISILFYEFGKYEQPIMQLSQSAFEKIYENLQKELKKE